MKVMKRICGDTCEVTVVVVDQPHASETLIGFENRLIETVNKLINPAEVNSNVESTDD